MGCPLALLLSRSLRIDCAARGPLEDAGHPQNMLGWRKRSTNLPSPKAPLQLFLASPSLQMLDFLVLEKLHTITPPTPCQVSKRDMLWVECKASSQAKPHQWSNAIEEAVERLNAAHPDRNIYLILNVGLKWIIFYWNPTNPAAAGQNLHIMDAAGQPRWSVDPRVRPAQNGGIQFIFGGDPITNGGQTVLKYQNDLTFLENCLAHIGGANFVGQNDPSFD
ncbi:hypothetical protein F5883DRAFT_514081 [Diaporthe sp. PMI_573]|nr:hypothetical protein F5883DRAFT_514081 [Diaporthaceae sp. PMI_573]